MGKSVVSDRPLPMADAVLVGRVARRAGVLVAELGQVRAVAAGLLGSDAGWSGSAELAFQDSFAARLAEFGPVLARLDGYAAALAGYAREMAAVEPRLGAARSRLDGAPEDPAALAAFESCWRDWDAARRRCMARLQATAPPQHRHWWSGWAHAVTGVVEHGVELASCSRLLAEVGQGLVAAGLVCALVAGPIWAAVAVVAVCQLAVDAARRARGEHVGWGTLGWDLAAVLPAGRAVRRVHAAVEEVTEYRTAAEADAAIRRLPKRLRSSPLVPGGGLQAHEGTATYRGHTIAKHVKKTRKELAQRFRTEQDLKVSSSFTDRRIAEAAIGKVLKQHKQTVDQWLGTRKKGLVLEAECDRRLGISLHRNGRIVATTRARVILRREESSVGYYIKSAFPVP
jgi:hypothetical protein